MSEGSPRSGHGASNRNLILIGVVVAVLVVALVGGGIAAFGLASGSSRGSSQPSAGPVASPPASTPATSSSPAGPAPASLKAYYAQRLHWKACGAQRCATLRVPLDYAHPGAKAITIAVNEVLAPDQSAVEGDLVVNPGGPGGSGLTYASEGSAAFGPVLPAHFNLIGFDPRGVGKSTPLECVGTKQLDALVGYDPAPSTLAERNKMDSLIRAFGQGCLRTSGDLARHMSTVDVARDMDLLRSALGEKKLDYFGASYGTFLGATYANLFPHRVGRMVLDGAINPALSNLQLSLTQAHGFEVALRSYVANCVSQGNCPLGDSVDAGITRIQQLLAATETHPLPTGMGRPLTEGWATLGVWLPLYSKSYWPNLTSALNLAISDGNGQGLMQLADAYVSRGPTGYLDNSMNALYAVNCLDHDDYIPTSQVPKYFPQFEKASPTFGKDFAFGLSTCSDWPVKSHQRTHALHAPGAAPIIVIGTTRDPATPVEWAESLSRQLDSGVLITRNGDGHTAFNEGNSCVDDAVDNYLVKDQVPKNGLAC